MDAKFTVSEMASLNGISRQTLIHYDKEGVFKPRIINPENGYRYYTADQLETLDSILMLKEIGLSLKEIKEHMLSRNEISTLEILRNQSMAIKERIKKLEILDNRISRKITSIDNFANDYQDNGKIIYCDSEYMAIKKVSRPHNLVAVDIALKKLFKQASINNYAHFYQTGDIVLKEHLKKGLYRKFSFVFLPLEEPCEEKSLHLKPQGYYICGYHIGPYETMNKTYELLIKRINDLGYIISGDSYEYYIFDNLTNNTTSSYITEIQIKVDKK